MKKVIIFVLFFLILLTGCDPNSYYFDYEKLNAVEYVQLIDYVNPDAKEIFNQKDQLLSFDFEKMSIIETLEMEQLSAFKEEFKKIRFLSSSRYSDSPKGISIRIVYNDNTFEIVSHEVMYVGSFNDDGTVFVFVGRPSGTRDIVSLINKFFETKVE